MLLALHAPCFQVPNVCGDLDPCVFFFLYVCGNICAYTLHIGHRGQWAMKWYRFIKLSCSCLKTDIFPLTRRSSKISFPIIKQIFSFLSSSKESNRSFSITKQIFYLHWTDLCPSSSRSSNKSFPIIKQIFSLHRADPSLCHAANVLIMY